MRGARGPNKCGAAIGTTRVRQNIEEEKKEKEREKIAPLKCKNRKMLSTLECLRQKIK